MYRKSAEVKRREKIGKLLDNGLRFAVVINGKVIFTCRYEYQATQRYPSEKATPIINLFNEAAEVVL